MNNLKIKLEFHYNEYNKSDFVKDPVRFPHRYTNPADIEISAFISALFAYGKVELILDVLEKIHNIMGESPNEFVKNFDVEEGHEIFGKLKYRFYSTQDIINLFEILHNAINEYGSLKKLFLAGYRKNDKNIQNALAKFVLNLPAMGIEGYYTRGTNHMFSSPLKGSACKRLNLFLRWMVRKDKIDFGIWNEISPAQLVIPVDIHIARLSKELGLTNLKSTSWVMAEQITENLKKYNSGDPVKYDFAICHIGMLKKKF